MSKPRYRWWGFARRMIRDYRSLKVECDTQNCLSADDRKAYDAVARAIEITNLRPDGKERLAMIRYVYWYKKEHTVKDAAPRLHIAEATAKRWHGDFVRLVGKCYGLLQDDTPEP